MSIHFDPKDNLIFLTNRIGRQLSGLILKDMERECPAKEYRPQSTHMAIIADLYEQKDGQRQQDLAVSSIKDKATIARSLAQMEKEGIVIRTTDPMDRRNKLISLTEKGRNIIDNFLPCMHNVMDVAAQGIDIQQLADCKRTLARIYQNLQAHINHPQDD